MHEELTNDGRSRWLAGGERGGSLSHDGEKWAEGGGSFGRRLLLGRGGGERCDRTTVPHISEDTPAANGFGRDTVRQSGPPSRLAPRAARSV
jgi:hypothetical protein